jgi:hypothetical protein
MRKIISGILVPALLAASIPGSARAAAIPHGETAAARPSAPDLRGAPAGAPSTAAGLSGPLDKTELAQLEKTDLRQAGGDGVLIVLAAVGALALVIWLIRGIDDDDDDDDNDIGHSHGRYESGGGTEIEIND